MSARTTALLRDLNSLLGEIQPMLSGVGSQSAVQSIRTSRRRIGEALERPATGDPIIDGYRADAIDAVEGIATKVLITSDWRDADLTEAQLACEMAADRIRHYIMLRRQADKEAACAAG